MTRRVPQGSIVARLGAAGCVYAEEEAGLLAGAADGEQLETLVRRRIAGEPLEVILGWAAFRGHRIPVAPGVFVPRARTGILVDQALPLAGPGVVAVELCAGAAAVAVALAAEAPGTQVHAAELDPAAVRLARTTLGPERVHEGDLYEALPAGLRGRVGILLANAPYVPTAELAHLPAEAREYEPAMALDGGPDGLDVQRRVIAEAPAWLAPGGALIVETSRGQAAATAALMVEAGLRARVAHDDDIDGTAAIGVLEPGRSTAAASR